MVMLMMTAGQEGVLVLTNVAVAVARQGDAAMAVAMRAAVSVRAVVVRAVVMVLVRAAVTVRTAALAATAPRLPPP